MKCCAFEAELCIRRGTDYSSAAQFNAPWYVFDTLTNTNVSFLGATGTVTFRTGGSDETTGDYVFAGTEVTGNIVFQKIGTVWCFSIYLLESDIEQSMAPGCLFWVCDITLPNGVVIRPVGGTARVEGSTS